MGAATASTQGDTVAARTTGGLDGRETETCLRGHRPRKMQIIGTEIATGELGTGLRPEGQTWIPTSLAMGGTTGGGERTAREKIARERSVGDGMTRMSAATIETAGPGAAAGHRLLIEEREQTATRTDDERRKGFYVHTAFALSSVRRKLQARTGSFVTALGKKGGRRRRNPYSKKHFTAL